MAKTGRPSSFTQDVANAICDRLMQGESLRSICRDDAMPDRSTVVRWLADNDLFHAQYARARDIGLDQVADEVFEIADDGTNDYVMKQRENGKGEVRVADTEHLARSRLRFDARRWYLSKLAPKRYGEKQTVEHTGPNGGPIAVKDETSTAARIASLIALAASRASVDDGVKELLGDDDA